MDNEPLYDELRSIARRHLHGERSDHTLCATDLVHEAWRRAAQIGVPLSAHSKAGIATLFRRVLVDHARVRNSNKRTTRRLRSSVDVESLVNPNDQVATEDLLSLHEALEALAQLDARQARIVELKYFGGLTAVETGADLEVSSRTVENEWRMARAWLFDYLGGVEPGAPKS